MNSSLLFQYFLFLIPNFSYFYIVFLYGLCFSFSPINVRISRPWSEREGFFFYYFIKIIDNRYLAAISKKKEVSFGPMCKEKNYRSPRINNHDSSHIFSSPSPSFSEGTMVFQWSRRDEEHRCTTAERTVMTHRWQPLTPWRPVSIVGECGTG